MGCLPVLPTPSRPCSSHALSVSVHCHSKARNRSGPALSRARQPKAARTNGRTNGWPDRGVSISPFGLRARFSRPQPVAVVPGVDRACSSVRSGDPRPPRLAAPPLSSLQLGSSGSAPSETSYWSFFPRTFVVVYVLPDFNV